MFKKKSTGLSKGPKSQIGQMTP